MFMDRSYKVRRRRQNCQALVNAAFLMPIQSDGAILGLPTLVFGGLEQKITRAKKAEKFFHEFIGSYKRPFDEPDTMAKLFATVHDECDPGDISTLADPAYRRNLAVALFYKV